MPNRKAFGEYFCIQVTNRANHIDACICLRLQRARQKRARYLDVLVDEEDLFEGRSFDVEQKLVCERFAGCESCVKELDGSKVTLELFQKNGFKTPMLVKENTNNGENIGLSVCGSLAEISQILNVELKCFYV